MRVFVDVENDKQVLKDDISGKVIELSELRNHILLDMYEDKYCRMVLVFTDHSFENELR